MKRLLQLFPIFMLTFFMWAVGVSFNSSSEIKIESQFEFQKNYKASHFSNFHTAEVEEGDFIFIESEPEFEIELDWFLISSKQGDLPVVEVKVNSKSYTSQLFSSKETIPLYDLYCTWKFHLS